MSLNPYRVAEPGLLRVQVDHERCQGHARCVAVASELFQLDAFGNAHEIGDGIVSPGLEVKVRLAASHCPELAISLRNKVTDMPTRPPVTDRASDFDHLDPAWVDNPYPIWDELRQKCPIAHTDRFMGVCFVSRHEDVRAVAHDTEHFSSRRGVAIREGPPQVTPAPPITSDPPAHSAQQKLLLPAFTPDAIRRFEPQTRAICRELLEHIAGRSGADGAIDYAQEIPVRVIAAMLGVPPQSGDLFRRWIHEVFELGITDRNAMERAVTEMGAFFASEIAERRKMPREDLITFLAEARIDGRKLDDEHITGTLRLLLVAGIDTTWSLIGSCLWHLANHPDDQQAAGCRAGADPNRRRGIPARLCASDGGA